MLVGAIKACAELEEDKRCVMIFGDGIRNYMSKFLCDSWMISKGFMIAENDKKLW